MKDILSKALEIRKGLFAIRLRLPSERIVSLFTKYRLDCFSLLYDNPRQGEPFVITVNAFGLILPEFSDISLRSFLQTHLIEEIYFYEMVTQDLKPVLGQLNTCPTKTVESWIRCMVGRSWAKETAFHFCHKIIAGKQASVSFLDKSSNGTKGKSTRDNDILFQRDLRFLEQTWPSIQQLLLKNEFKFSIAIANEDSLVHYISNGIHEGVLDYKELRKTKYKDLLPETDHNQLISLQVEPGRPVNEVIRDMRNYVMEIAAMVENDLPVEIAFDRLTGLVNDLLSSAGEDPIELTIGGNTPAVLTTNQSKEQISLQDGHIIRLYNGKNFEVDEDLTPEVCREILFYIDSMATPDRPYDMIRASLIRRIENENNSQ